MTQKNWLGSKGRAREIAKFSHEDGLVCCSPLRSANCHFGDSRGGGILRQGKLVKYLSREGKNKNFWETNRKKNHRIAVILLNYETELIGLSLWLFFSIRGGIWQTVSSVSLILEKRFPLRGLMGEIAETEFQSSTSFLSLAWLMRSDKTGEDKKANRERNSKVL